MSEAWPAGAAGREGGRDLKGCGSHAGEAPGDAPLGVTHIHTHLRASFPVALLTRTDARTCALHRGSILAAGAGAPAPAEHVEYGADGEGDTGGNRLFA